MAQRTETVAGDTASENSRDGARPSDELLPFLNNFHDIFTTIGVLILMGGLAVGTGQVMASLGLDEGDTNWQFALMGLIGGIAIVLWSLSALLVGRQRRILPGIVLSVGFVIAAAILIVWGYGQFLIHGVGINEATFEGRFDALDDMEFGREAVSLAAAHIPWSVRIMPIVVGLAAFIPSALYYFSFRLPFAGGLMGVSLASLAALTLFTLDPYTVAIHAPAVGVAIGGSLLLAGIMFDVRDPARQTRLSGTAFWLHFFAAPILLSSVLNVVQLGWSLSESDFADPSSTNLMAALGANNGNAMELAIAALIVIAIFALVSLLINRRALIVSGLLTAGISIGVLVNASGLGAGGVIAVTLLVLGGVVVVLGAAWNPVRGILLAPFPSEGPLARLFPPANGAVG